MRVEGSLYRRGIKKTNALWSPGRREVGLRETRAEVGGERLEGLGEEGRRGRGDGITTWDASHGDPQSASTPIES